MAKAAPKTKAGWIPPPVTPEDTFAWRLLRVRQAMEMTQVAFAEMCGVSKSAYNSWENGRIPHEMNEAVRLIVQATGCDREWLMWGDASTRWLHAETETAGQPPLGVVGQQRLALGYKRT